MPHLERANIIFEEAHASNKKVFIHCAAGVSRSASLAIGYLMKLNKWAAEEALEYVQSKRPCVDPNYSFTWQLSEYHKYITK